MTKYNIVDRAKFIFYQIPKLLIHGEKYKNLLSHSDIITYSILMDRLNISIKNNWLDKEGNIYFVYTNKQLMDILNVTENTVINTKKNLIKAGLLEQERTGRANRLYLLEPQIDNVDEAKYIMELDKKEIVDKTRFTEEDKKKISRNLRQNKSIPTEEPQNLQFVDKKLSNQGSVENEFPKNRKLCSSELQSLQPSNNNLIRNKDIKDNKEIQNIDKNHLELITNSLNEKDAAKENNLIDAYIKDNYFEHLYGEKIIREIKKMSRSDLDTFKAYMNKLVFAQKSAEKEEEVSIPTYDNNPYAEYTNDQLLSAFNRCMYQFRFGKVNNIESYLFISFKTVFKDLALALKESI